jgi:putative spermidine/putrescine transport system permease protein
MTSFIPPCRRLWLYVIAALILIYLLVPTLIVIPMSFSESDSLRFPPPALSLRWYAAYFGDEEWRDATFVSLRLAVLTTIFATPLGTAAAYALHAGQFRFARLIQGALLSALMVPLILFAVAAYFLFARLGLVNTLTGLVLTDTVLTVPFVMITVAAGLNSYDMNQERVAQSLGASRLHAFFTVTLPQIRFSIITGAVLAFLGAFDEVIIATFLSAGQNQTLTARMFASLRDEVDPTIAAVSTLMTALTMGLPLIVQSFRLLGGRGGGTAGTVTLPEP